MSINDIYRELCNNMGKVYAQYVPFDFYIYTNMAINNCHVTAVATAMCLKDVRIVTVNMPDDEKEKHSWAEKDGFAIDATMKIIVPAEMHRGGHGAVQEIKTLQEYKHENSRFVQYNIKTQQQILDMPKRKLESTATYMALLYKKVHELNTSDEIKKSLENMLLRDYNQIFGDGHIAGIAQKYTTQAMENAFCEVVGNYKKRSLLFNPSPVKLVEDDFVKFNDFSR